MYLKYLSIIVLFFISMNASSLDSDASAEIIIESDRAEIDRKAGTATYIGHVELTQGTLLIHADRITLYSNKSNQLTKAIAKGKPAHFQQQMEGDKGLTKATSNVITYKTIAKTVTLFEEAILKQEGHSFSGNLITYDIANESVSAIGKPNTSTGDTINPADDGRIKMIIQPATLDETPSNEDS